MEKMPLSRWIKTDEDTFIPLEELLKNITLREYNCRDITTTLPDTTDRILCAHAPQPSLEPFYRIDYRVVYFDSYAATDMSGQHKIIRVGVCDVCKIIYYGVSQ